MARTATNFWVDALALAEFMFLATTGVLVRYLLPPGSGHAATMLGLDRHEWGAVHFWVAVALLATLAVHLVLHWKWIVCVVKGRRSSASGRRLLLGGAGLAGVMALAAAPLFAPVEMDSSGQAARHEDPPVIADQEHDGAIDGRTSLAELEQATGVTRDELRHALGIEAELRPSDRLGPLRRQYGFEMQDVRRLVTGDSTPRAE